MKKNLISRQGTWKTWASRKGIISENKILFPPLEKESNIVMEPARLLLEAVSNPADFKENSVRRILVMKDIRKQLEEIADNCQDAPLVIQGIEAIYEDVAHS